MHVVLSYLQENYTDIIPYASIYLVGISRLSLFNEVANYIEKFKCHYGFRIMLSIYGFVSFILLLTSSSEHNNFFQIFILYLNTKGGRELYLAIRF